MFAALLLAASPLILPRALTLPAVPGAPCVCFPLHHAGERTLPEDPLGQAGWKPGRLVDEALRIVRTTDDLFLRAETLRTTLRALGQRSGGPSDAEVSTSARRALFEQLTADLVRETELAPLSRARIEVGRDHDATLARLSALPGVARVERSPSDSALILWFDANVLTDERLRESAPASPAPAIQPPTQAPRAFAAITLAFAGQSSTQLGHGVDFDPHSLAREAARLQPKDARVLILAAMVWFDEAVATSATFARDAVRNAAGDEYAQKNLLSTIGVFFDADTLEELLRKLDRRIQRG